MLNISIILFLFGVTCVPGSLFVYLGKLFYLKEFIDIRLLIKFNVYLSLEIDFFFNFSI